MKLEPVSTRWIPLAFLIFGTAWGCNSPDAAQDNAKRTPDDAGVTDPDVGPAPDADRCHDIGAVRAMLLTSSCASGGCHNESDQAAGLDLLAIDVASNLVGARSTTCDGWSLVSPGAPEQSFLYAKITGTQACGERMPRGLAPLGDSEIACVRSWIAGLGGGGGEDPVDAGALSDDGGAEATLADAASESGEGLDADAGMNETGSPPPPDASLDGGSDDRAPPSEDPDAAFDAADVDGSNDAPSAEAW